MRTLLQDTLYSARSLQKTPGFTAMAVVTLVIGIAANTVVFSIVNASLLRPLPYAHPGRLVILTWYDPQGRLSRGDISASAFLMLQDRARCFQSIAAVYSDNVGVNAAALGPPRYKKVQRVSLDFFRTLGVAPARGRGFSAEEDRVGGRRAVVLSHAIWEQEYNQDLSALGSDIRINGEPYSIVGIMPKDFRSYPEADLWLPLQLSSATEESGNEYRVIARLKDDVTREQARQELAATPEYRLAYPARALSSGVVLAPQELQGFIVARARKSLYLLFGAVVFVLLITCTNLALFLAVRGARRTHEFSVRAALGSSRLRLIRVALMDGVLIAFLGGLVGTVAAKELIPFIGWLAPADLPLSAPISIDLHVFVFVVAISTASVILSGLAPAMKMSRVSLDEMLRQSPQAGTYTVQQTRLGRLLVTAQTALTMLLLAGTVSLLHSFLSLQATPAGFDSENVSVAQISLLPGRYTTTSATAQILDQIFRDLRAVPGVEAVASINGLPMEQGLGLLMYPAGARDKHIYGETQFRIASPEYFRVMHIPLLAGRLFTEHDDGGGRPVAIVTDSLARRWWPNESPLGQYVETSGEFGRELSDVPREVIGVVGDIREAGLETPPPPTVFVALKETPDSLSAFVNRTFPTSIVLRSARSANVYETLNRALAGADRDLAIVSLRPLAQVVSTSLARPRFYVSLTGIFGAFALFLTAVGLYGLLSYQLALRTREIALRISMGAKRLHIIGMILKQGFATVTVGILLGCGMGILVAKSLGSVIYNTPGITSFILVTAALLLAAIAFLTSLLIALRATAIEPMLALRIE